MLRTYGTLFLFLYNFYRYLAPTAPVYRCLVLSLLSHISRLKSHIRNPKSNQHHPLRIPMEHLVLEITFVTGQGRGGGAETENGVLHNGFTEAYAI